MNGLKYIRIKCNYSQRALAEVLGVSRQAVNMWENSKKRPSKEREEQLCRILGIEDPAYLGEITGELQQKIEKLPIYRIPFDGDSERFAFKPVEQDDLHYNHGLFIKHNDEQLSLDEKCMLKRAEIKKLFEEISNYMNETDKKNSFDNLSGLNRTLQIFERTLDAAKESRKKHPEYVMVYFYTILAVLDAMNISFGNVDKNDVLNRTVFEYQAEWYDYRKFTVDLSEIITNHLDSVCEEIPTKRECPHSNYRRRTK